jgi:hypothetical protein
MYTDMLGSCVIFMRMVGMTEVIATLGLIVGYCWARFTLASTGVYLVSIIKGQAVSQFDFWTAPLRQHIRIYKFS